ncbi:hypothetical protein [uncultured Chryseobacterium sp.]|uniref:hypothetical protein n=1 Tax=uncultured Chryseobacterium sp. TaxID=259322 RepID=UPI002590F9FA|nr:hypothetical protein [uncultured Chryseobacterium sp.]
MFEELIERYSQYSDTELVTTYSNKNAYTQDAQKALEIEIKNRGGLELLKIRYNTLIQKENEKVRISKEAGLLYLQGFTNNDINSRMNSELLSSEEIHEITETSCNKINASRKDKEIKPRTFIGSITGGIIGGTIGGILWSLQLIYSGHIFYLFAIGLVIISYGVIKLFTKQSKNNTIVLIFTIASVIYALVLGFYLYGLFGYRGPQ